MQIKSLYFLLILLFTIITVLMFSFFAPTLELVLVFCTVYVLGITILVERLGYLRLKARQELLTNKTTILAEKYAQLEEKYQQLEKLSHSSEILNADITTRSTN